MAFKILHIPTLLKLQSYTSFRTTYDIRFKKERYAKERIATGFFYICNNKLLPSNHWYDDNINNDELMVIEED